MVQYRYTDTIQYGNHSPSKLHILRGWLRLSARMVMSKHNCRAAGPERRCHQSLRIYPGFRRSALRYTFALKQPLRRIQAEQIKTFPLPVLEQRAEICRDL